VFNWLGDFYSWQTGEYPPEESFVWFESGLNGIIDGLQNIPGKIQEMIVPYLTGIDDLDAGLEQIRNQRGNLQNLFTNTVRSLGGISKQIAENPKVYDARFKHMKKLRNDEYNTWSKSAKEAERDFDKIQEQMPIVNIGGISMQSQARNAKSDRDRMLQMAGEGRNAAIGGLEGIEKGFMDTRTASQNARAGISGEMIPNALNSMSNNLSEMTGIDEARANLLGSRLNVETMPQQWESQLANPTANLMANRYAALMDPYEYIKNIQQARAGTSVSESTGESSGFSIGIPGVGGISF